MDPVLVALAGGGLLTAAVTVYRARSDKESSVAVAAKGLAEASAVLVDPLRRELVVTHERIASLEIEVKQVHAAEMKCQELLNALHSKVDVLDTRMTKGEEKIVETKEKVVEAEDRIAEVENNNG